MARPVLIQPRVKQIGVLLIAISTIGCRSRDRVYELSPKLGKTVGLTTIHQPVKLTSIETPIVDGVGHPIRVECSTCHSLRSTTTLSDVNTTTKQFHKGLSFQHGHLTCISCHTTRPFQAPMFHLSDGSEIPTQEAIRLCTQCHGPQYRDYQHGSHGGMNGYWDMSRGSRLRNHCVDCHDPHVPRFQSSRPVLPPRDRFLDSLSTQRHTHE